MLAKMFATTALATAALAGTAVSAQGTDQERVFDNEAFVFPIAGSNPGEERETYDLSLWSWYYDTSRNPDPSLPSPSCAEGTDPVERYPFQARFREIDVTPNDPFQTYERPFLHGNIPLDASWGAIYQQECNSAAILIRSSDPSRFDMSNTIVDGARLVRVLDGIRTAATAQDFTIRNVWLTIGRDDCIENDPSNAGTISDSLFEGCFNGISMRNTSTSAPTSSNVVVIDRLLMSVAAYPYLDRSGNPDSDGPVVSGDFFKSNDKAAKAIITNSIFAYDLEDGEALGAGGGGFLRYFAPGGAGIESCSNNTVLWLRDDAPPADIQNLDQCFELVSGQAARDIWNRERCEWINDHPPTITRRQRPDASQNAGEDPITCFVPSVTISSPAGGEFAFDAEVPLSATALTSDNVSVASGLTWTSSIDGELGTGGDLTVGPLTQGNHLITARYVNSIEVAYEDTVSITVAPQPVELTVDLPPNTRVIEGETVALDATLTGGDPANYRFWWAVRSNTTGNDPVVIRDFADDAAFAWDTTGYPGNNRLELRARLIGTDGPDIKARARVFVDQPDPVRSVSLDVSPRSPSAPGTLVTLTAEARNAEGIDVEYRFDLQPMDSDGDVVILRDFATDPTFQWDTSGYPGRNRITVRARRAGTEDRDVKANAMYWVRAPRN
ncbi:hypothetical protein [Erythrobacter litoralis]|uniref:Ig-like domain-containing protein n=1 Tax=Erythrobacter litoralis (strain HTCC2594) TaxID=314225 RepID=Q2N8E9_ERYLH|nr:hypothetical protein [Erythrobacter litoralis]ABC64042.1 hypothetical protein ELI_09750 [Erythrobacter litoralis HTCC2594]